MLKLKHVINKDIRLLMSTTETTIDRIVCRSLKWFEHLLRMTENRWPKRMLNWAVQEEKNIEEES